MAARRKTADPASAITYVRVSTDEQAGSGLGLAAQRAKVADACERNNWVVVHEAADEGISAKTITGRPALTAALGMLERGEAANLVAAKLDRLSRSVPDFTKLIDLSVRQSWNLVVLDLGLDTSTPNGKFMAHVLAAVAQLERELIAERTSNALQAKKRSGIVLGRPDRSSAEIVEQIAEWRTNGDTLAAIANKLTETNVPTSQGGRRWYPSTVAAVLARQDVAVAGGHE